MCTGIHNDGVDTEGATIVSHAATVQRWRIGYWLRIQRTCSRAKRTPGASTTRTALDPMITVAFPLGRPSVVSFVMNA